MPEASRNIPNHYLLRANEHFSELCNTDYHTTQKKPRYIGAFQVPQTGIELALDVSCPSVGLQLEDCFASTTEGKWLASHAPLYGFIIRYPKNKELITGYGWEPWHIRYVGKSLALYLSLTGLTLEEYHEHQSSFD